MEIQTYIFAICQEITLNKLRFFEILQICNSDHQSRSMNLKLSWADWFGK